MLIRNKDFSLRRSGIISSSPQPCRPPYPKNRPLALAVNYFTPTLELPPSHLVSRQQSLPTRLTLPLRNFPSWPNCERVFIRLRWQVPLPNQPCLTLSRLTLALPPFILMSTQWDRSAASAEEPGFSESRRIGGQWIRGFRFNDILLERILGDIGTRCL